MTFILNFIKANLHFLMIPVILLGFGNVYLFGGFDTPKTVLLLVVVLFVIYPVMINTKFEEVFSHFKDPRPVYCSLAINFIVSPLAAFFLARLFLGESTEMFTALILISLVPTSAMSAAWTAFSGAKMATALYLIPLNILFSAAIGLPFLFPLFLGDMLSIDTFSILKNLLLVFAFPLIVGDITRRTIIRMRGKQFFAEKIKPNLGSVSAVGLLLLIFLVMSLKRNTILLHNLPLLLLAIVPVVLYYVVMYSVSVPWTLFLVKKGSMAGEKAVVIVYTSVARHINISIAIVLTSFPMDQVSSMLIVLIVAYLVQLPSLAIFSQKYGKKIVSKDLSKLTKK